MYLESVGNPRRFAKVARALSLDPRLIIADESTSMLDVSIRISLLSMLSRLKDELGVGFLFITHDLALAKYFGRGGTIAVMYLGRIVEYGPTAEVIGAPRHPYTQALLAAIPEPDPDLNEQKRAAGSLLRHRRRCHHGLPADPDDRLTHDLPGSLPAAPQRGTLRGAPAHRLARWPPLGDTMPGRGNSPR